MKKLFYIHIYSLLALILFSACAKMGSPDGGWYDETPPKVIGASPADKATNVKTKNIKIYFDEFIKIEDAQNKVVVSPPQLEAAEIVGKGKYIDIKLLDSLKENTTYTIDFSDAISDNNEGNPLGNYTYSFSTGEVIDTMEVSGYVLESENLEPIKGILVGLYNNLSDTVFCKEPMLRVSRTDSRGHFVIKGIAPGSYRIYALQDADGDYVFNQKSEKIAFSHDIIVPSSRPDIRQDTTWVDSLHIKSIEQVPYTHFLPDDIVLRAFTETLTDRAFIKSERKEADHFTLYFTYGNEKDGIENPDLLAFWYDPTRTSEAQKVRAYRYKCIVDENGGITIDESVARKEETSRDIIADCLRRLMDQLIIVGDIEDGHEFYKSKGGTPIRVFRDGSGRIAFAGGWQIDHNNKPLAVNPEDIYTKDNGKSYVINGQMPLTTDQSVYLTLDGREEFSKFLDLMDNDGADLFATTVTKNNYTAGMTKKSSKNLKLLDNYNYTIYAPTNNSIQELIDKGLLPTWEDYEAQTDSIWGTEDAAEQAKAIIKDIIVSFVRYHVQDHAIMIGMAPELYDEREQEEGGNKVIVKTPRYENTFETMRRNLETGRFYPVTVNNEGDQMWVQDVRGNKRNVIKTDGLYNRICREYWFKTSGQCYMASDAVVHQIDGVLLTEEMKPWKELLNKNVRRK